ncbi:negative regulator of reactive oxygen species-like [Arapaima gigas]
MFSAHTSELRGFVRAHPGHPELLLVASVQQKYKTHKCRVSFVDKAGLQDAVHSEERCGCLRAFKPPAVFGPHGASSHVTRFPQLAFFRKHRHTETQRTRPATPRDPKMFIISSFLPSLLCFSMGLMENHQTMASLPCRLVQKAALCNSCQLSLVPRNLPEDTEDLQLNGNSIEILRNHSLAQYPSLRSLSCANSQVDSIEINFFYNAYHLENLNLAENNLHTSFHQSGWALHSLVRLKSLDLSRNGLTEDMASFLLQDMTSLEYLSLSRNVLLRLDEKTFRDLHRLRELNLERNMLFEIDGAFDSLHKLQRLNVAFNNLPCLIQFQLTELVVLNASHNAVEWFVSNQVIEDTFRLDTLDLSDNNLLFFPFLPIRSHIRNLLLSDNHISFYEHLANHTAPNWTTRVVFSNINGSESHVSAKLWDETILHGGLSTLELLDMSGNQVSYLPRGFLNKLTSLTSLRLQRNCLQSLDLTVEELPVTLTELDVSNNRKDTESMLDTGPCVGTVA